MPSTATSVIDGLSTSVAVKAPCAAVATANITLSGLQTVNGVTVVDADRVLVTGQTDATENGIYAASSSTWLRTKDADGNRDLVQGTRVLVRADSVDGVEYELTSDNPIVIDTTELTFELRYGANALYDQTAAELAAGVTPQDYNKLPGDWFRYGCVADGVTDDRAAIQRWYSQYKQGGAPAITPAGVCYVAKDGANVYSLLFDDDVFIDGKGALTLKGHASNEYTLMYLTGGTSVDVDIRGVTFNNNKAAPSRAVDNNDIGLRVQSSVNTFYVENCAFKNANEDGIYFNATVTGMGGTIKDCSFSAIARTAFTIVKGQYISFRGNRVYDIQLQPITVQPTDNTTVLRHIDIDDNEIIGGGYDNHNPTTDRCGIFLAGKTGASVADQRFLRARNNRISGFGAAFPGSAYAFGIESREITDVIVQDNEIYGCLDAGAYSYLTTRAVYKNNVCIGNDVGLWMNFCTDYSDIGNTCVGNTTYDRDYLGPDGATTFVQADGLNFLLARGSVSYSGGVPSFNSRYGVNSAIEDLGTGDARFTFTRTQASANYSVSPDFRSHSGTSGLIESASHTTTTFRVLGFSGGAASDQGFEFTVTGPAPRTREPA